MPHEKKQQSLQHPMEGRVKNSVLSGYDLRKVQDSIAEWGDPDSPPDSGNQGGCLGGSTMPSSSGMAGNRGDGVPGQIFSRDSNPVQIVERADLSQEEDDTSDSDDEQYWDPDGGASSQCNPSLPPHDGPPKALHKELYNLSDSDGDSFGVQLHHGYLERAAPKETFKSICQLVETIVKNLGGEVHYLEDKIRIRREKASPPLDTSERELRDDTEEQVVPDLNTQNVWLAYKARLSQGFNLKKRIGPGFLTINSNSFKLGQLEIPLTELEQVASPLDILKIALGKRGVLKFVSNQVVWE
ncbi:MAG: phosphoprotein [Wufeng bat tupavirus 2]|nr:MAG: phosphoprotein [Wufeng bat tupavirus 2]